MKVNLTKLLELALSARTRIDNENSTGNTYRLEKLQDRTSPEDGYAFELEGEVLENRTKGGKSDS